MIVSIPVNSPLFYMALPPAMAFQRQPDGHVGIHCMADIPTPGHQEEFSCDCRKFCASISLNAPGPEYSILTKNAL